LILILQPLLFFDKTVLLQLVWNDVHIKKVLTKSFQTSI